MQDERITIVAEQVLGAAERLEVILRTEQTVPEHLLKHFAKRIWELRATMIGPDQMLEKLHQRIQTVQNNMAVLDHYLAGGFRFENHGVSSPLPIEPDPFYPEADW